MLIRECRVYFSHFIRSISMRICRRHFNKCKQTEFKVKPIFIAINTSVCANEWMHRVLCRIRQTCTYVIFLLSFWIIIVNRPCLFLPYLQLTWFRFFLSLILYRFISHKSTPGYGSRLLFKSIRDHRLQKSPFYLHSVLRFDDSWKQFERSFDLN